MINYDFISLTEKGACNLLKNRSELSHKGSFGTLLAVAGSACFTGAASLCVMAAIKSGVGIVCLASVQQACAAAGILCPEATFLPLEADCEGKMTDGAFEAIAKRAETASAMLLGCGMGRSSQVSALVKKLLATEIPSVVDADALNAACGSLGLLKDKVITPHMGEMARLCGCGITEIKADSAAAALKFSRENGCVVVLKDADTVVAAPDGRIFLNEGRNSGMAKGGSGDVLAGLAASFLAQGVKPFEAAIAAVKLHSAAGERCAKKYSRRGMLPHELPDMLREIFLENEL